MTAADEGRQEPRTAGSLNHDDLGREVAVELRHSGEVAGVLLAVEHKVDEELERRSVLYLPGRMVTIPADAPIHVHEEEAGR